MRGTIIKHHKRRIFDWYDILFPSGIYEVRQDAIEVIEASSD